MACKFRECAECYFEHRAPEICQGCVAANQFEPDDDQDSLMKLKAVRFGPLDDISIDYDEDY